MDSTHDNTIIIVSDEEDSSSGYLQQQIKQSKKRKVEEMSKNPIIVLEEELSNSSLLLKKIKLEDDDDVTIIEKPVNLPEKILLDFKQKNIEKQSIIKEETDLVKLEEMSQPPSLGDNPPVMWINRLRHYPEDRLTKNMISFKQLISEDLSGSLSSRKKLKVAFMTSFGFSRDILETVLESGAKFTLADNWKHNSDPKIVKNYLGYSNLTLIRPPKDPAQSYQGTFHSKLWLLRFPSFLRVVVSSGNLYEEHWSIFSNSAWFRDFPKISTLSSVPNVKQVPKGEFDYDKDFNETLISFVQALMPIKTHYTNLIDINIHDYFISGIDIILIPSIPGKHTGNDIDKYGHRRLCAVLKKLEGHTSKHKKYVMSYQTSSVGNLNEEFLQEVMASFLPNYMSLNELKSKQKGSLLENINSMNPSDLPSSRFKLIFPTKHYIETCIEGPKMANQCLMLNNKDYHRPTFPKHIFYRYQAPQGFSYHEGVVPHIKTMIVTGEDEEIDDDTCIYFGSHNFSSVAWGKFDCSYNRFTISNTELGILVPPSKGSKDKKQEIIKGMSFRFPAEKYKSHQVPWTAKFIPW